jgi:hypothetical protein
MRCYRIWRNAKSYSTAARPSAFSLSFSSLKSPSAKIGRANLSRNYTKSSIYNSERK